ncbi:MAG: hypothetical protein MZV70_16765 [Desulfobacterales bacterium]|nr:hypothetical protein [Desulfobacterales bacterium]
MRSVSCFAMARPRPVRSELARRRTVGLDKGFEDGCLDAGLDPDARVTNGEDKVHFLTKGCLSGSCGDARNAVGIEDLDEDLAALGEFHGIPHEIDEYLPESLRITSDFSGDVFTDEAAKIQVLFPRLFSKELHRVWPQFPGRSKSPCSSSSLPASIFEMPSDRADDVQERLARCERRLCNASLFPVRSPLRAAVRACP